MDLVPSDEQQAFVTAAADWCRDHMPLARARDRPPLLWAQLDEMGWLDMGAPGIDLDHATEALVFAEMGAALAPMAMLSTAIAARWTGAADRTALLLVGGGKARALDPVGATRAVAIADGVATIGALPACAAEPGLDPSTPIALLDAPPALVPIDDPRAALALQLLAAAFAVGCADAARDMATEYAKIRHQFERPIGWFQALKHLCADMAVRAAVARSQLYYAACALDADDRDAAFHIAAAKQLADQAAIENGRVNIQVHGGIGMTDEAHPHLCLKRAHLLSFVAPARRDILLGEAA